MRTIVISATLAVVAALALTACGSGAKTTTLARYSSVEQIVSALNHGGLACTGGSSNAPVVSGASSETLCNFTPSDTALIDVFLGTVSNATVMQNSASTGTEQLWSDVGPNWWVQASHTYAERAQAILGGRIIAGPWNPLQAQASQTQAGPSCTQQVTSWLAEQDGSGLGLHTMQQDINDMMFDLAAYQKYDSSDTGAGQNFLSVLSNNTNDASYISTEIPSCADSNGTWQAFLNDATDASNDIAGTAQADSDVSATISDFNSLKEELASTAPGANITGLIANP